MVIKKLLLLSIFSLVMMSVIVSAAEVIIEGYGTISGLNLIDVEVDVEVGWNLIHGFANPSLITSGDINQKEIKAIYGFNPINQEYLRFYPNPGSNVLGAQDVRVDYMLMSTAFWVYSDSSGKMRYKTADYTPLNERRFLRGWNFVSLGEDMSGKKFSEIKGDCSIERAYYWNADVRGTSGWSFVREDSRIDPENVGYGILMKVYSDCKFGGNSSTIQPPSIPTSGNNKQGWNNYIYESNLGNVSYINSTISKGCIWFNANYTCNYNQANYKSIKNVKYNVLAEIHPANIDIFKFEYAITSRFPTINRVDSIGNVVENHFFLNDFESQNLIIWPSQNKILVISIPSETDPDDHPEIIELFKKYTDKYPSIL